MSGETGRETDVEATVAGRLADETATDRLGAALSRVLRPGDVVFLDGPLGAGKSALARAIIQARLAEEGREEPTPSPTYTLVQSYETARGPIQHADLYRLSDPEEAVELDLTEPDAASLRLIEWPGRLGPYTPARRLEIALDLPADGGAGRDLAARAVGEGWEKAIACLEEKLA